MTDIQLEQARHNMIVQQIRPWDVRDDVALAAMETIPREAFVPEHLTGLAFADMELPLDQGQSMLFPRIEGRILQAVMPRPGEKALVIGTGSGYLSAVVAQCGALVTSIEIDAILAQQAQSRIHQLEIQGVTIHVGDGLQGWGATAPYELIILTGSVEQAPRQLLEQLQVGGRMFVVVGQGEPMQARLYQRVNVSEWRHQELFETLLAPLVNGTPSTHFQF